MDSRITKFISYYRPYKKLFLADLFCALVSAVIALVIPLQIRYITQTVLMEELDDGFVLIVKAGLIMLVLLLIQVYCNYFVGYYGHVMGARMECDMRNELFWHYQKLSFSFYDRQKTGDLMSRLTNDLLSMTEMFHHGPEDLVISVLKLLGSFIVLWLINRPLTLLIVLCLPLIALYALVFSGRMSRAARLNRKRIGEINALAEDNLSGIRVVKSFANEAIEAEKFRRGNERFLESRSDIYKSETFFSDVTESLTQILMAGIVVAGGLMVVKGQLLLADLLLFLLYIGNFIDPVKRLANFIRLYEEGNSGYQRFLEIIEEEPEWDSAKVEMNKVVSGNISFRNVSFRYEQQKQDVLKNLNLDIRAGDYLALVGASGVGKTSLCSLIPRFYEPLEGDIYIDGENVKDIPLSVLRGHVGIVQQDVYLFAGTVYENIQYGKPGASREEIIAAAKQANAHEFIMELPRGYDTEIGQRGVRLSGGQKQRLSIARVFLKDPAILILDEATSALDGENEKIVQASLEKLAEDRTTLVIAHRLSTIQNARKILVLSEDGTAKLGGREELAQYLENNAYAKNYIF